MRHVFRIYQMTLKRCLHFVFPPVETHACADFGSNWGTVLFTVHSVHLLVFWNITWFVCFICGSSYLLSPQHEPFSFCGANFIRFSRLSIKVCREKKTGFMFHCISKRKCEVLLNCQTFQLHCVHRIVCSFNQWNLILLSQKEFASIIHDFLQKSCAKLYFWLQSVVAYIEVIKLFSYGIKFNQVYYYMWVLESTNFCLSCTASVVK